MLRHDEDAKDKINLLTDILSRGKGAPGGTFRAVRLRDDALLQAVARAFGKSVIGVRIQDSAQKTGQIGDWQGVTQFAHQ
jgi:hypothetical protein